MEGTINARNEYIVVTGAAGFIGSCLVGYLNQQGLTDIILVDAFDNAENVRETGTLENITRFPGKSKDGPSANEPVVRSKDGNLREKQFTCKVEREGFFGWLEKHQPRLRCVFHIGARTDTTEFDYSIHEHLNVEYSRKVWNYCTEKRVPLVYASSAATYGAGELGYEDSHAIIPRLQPLNPYGVSKNEFDKWVLQQTTHPPFWAGLKFFNVYGPNEYHKARMASVIFHSFNQIRANGAVKLFRSHRPDYKDGQQLRDFIYVKDLLKVCYWLMVHQPASAIYNLGTGKARSFEDLAKATFAGLGLTPNIVFIDMPDDIRDKYQYFTEADMHKLRDAGYKDVFYSLEDGVGDYVRNYLAGDNYY